MNQMVSQQREYVDSLMSEARLAAGLSHHNIATIHDFKIEGDVACIVMEYVPNSLDRELKTKGPMSPSRVAGLGIQICDALIYAHSKGFVHRDIKPHNILLSEDGTAKVTDFGIARATDLSSVSALGTPLYMSPEQCRGQESPDTRSDIYSLGATLYEMLTGETPFQGNAPQLYQKHINEPVPDFPAHIKVASNFVSIVKKCMEKAPDARYQNGEELVSDLRALSGAPSPVGGISEDSTVRLGRVDVTRSIEPETSKRRYPWTRIIAGAGGSIPTGNTGC
jgi:serine/threonine-protein kinase